MGLHFLQNVFLTIHFYITFISKIISLKIQVSTRFLIYYETGIISIDLENSFINDEGIKVLHEVLSENSTLQRLGLNRNPMGNEGLKFLTDSLCDNSTLLQLELSENEFGNERLMEIAL